MFNNLKLLFIIYYLLSIIYYLLSIAYFIIANREYIFFKQLFYNDNINYFLFYLYSLLFL